MKTSSRRVCPTPNSSESVSPACLKRAGQSARTNPRATAVIGNIQKGEEKMNLIIYLIAGAIVGYVASRIMQTNSQQGLLLDIVVGVVGAFLAGYFISPCWGSARSTMPLPSQPCWSTCWGLSFCWRSIRQSLAANRQGTGPLFVSSKLSRLAK